MSVIHFLNVDEGDCTWVKHPSGHNTIIDVCCAAINEDNILLEKSTESLFSDSVAGNFHQKEHPVNPIDYLNKFSISTIFRFILTHPDMDHMDGIKNIFSLFEVINFWDTNNGKKMDKKSDFGKYNEEDWKYYQKIRNNKENPKVLNLYSGNTGQFFNKDIDGKYGGDGIYILAPTEELMEEAKESGNYNDASYVLLFITEYNKKIIFAGDSGKKTWDYIIDKYKNDIKNIDILIAPHHGRKSGGNDDFLDILKPKLTLFGNAASKDLNYQLWNSKGLKFITNNQANCVIIDLNKNGIDIYVTNKAFAIKNNEKTYYSDIFQAWYIGKL